MVLDFIRGFVAERFPDPPEPRTYKALPSLLSIASLMLMSWAAVYMAEVLERPQLAYHLVVEEPTKKKFPFGRNGHGEVPPPFNVVSFIEETVCFFPNVLYTHDTTAKFFSECSKDFPDKISQVPIPKDEAQKAKLWTVLPFYFTVYGATLGWAFEIVLLLIGKPFQFNLNNFTTWIARLRFLNLAFVSSTIFFFSTALVIPSEDEPFLKLMFYVSVFMMAGLAPGLYWGGFRIRGGIDALPPTMLFIQVAQFVFVVTRKIVAGGFFAKCALAMNPVLQFSALLVTTATPMKSFGFHILSTGAGVSLYVALMMAATSDPNLPTEVSQSVRHEEDHVRQWPFVLATVVAGFVVVMKTFPMLFQSFRSEFSYTIWSLLYFILVGNPSPPAPKRLKTVYDGKPPKEVLLQPYSQSHPYQVSPNMSILAIRGDLPETIEENTGSLLQKITKLFSLIAKMDRFTPQANVNTPLEVKVRIPVTSDGQDLYPSTIFNLPFFDFPPMGKNLQRAPQPAVDSFEEGQLLAYLSQWGIGNTFLQMAHETDAYPYFELRDNPGSNGSAAGFVLDFRKLEAFENKDDYEPYGGVAYFELGQNKCLKLKWVIAPRAMVKILVDKKSGLFRRAEAMILSSLYFSVVAGKHLAEIHMTYNLLEVANINAFDVALNRTGGFEFNGHPIRVMLYIHLFSHGLAEELTTEHLVQQGAVFNQVFALKYDALVDYLSSVYGKFTYASDEDFGYRSLVNQDICGTDASYITTFDVCSPPVANALQWEKEYYQIFETYAGSIVKAVYANEDKNVKEDLALQDYYNALTQLFHKMPARYDEFQTINGVTKFVADTINHLVIRHQLYGTTAVASVMDPRLGSTQTPKDGGPPAVDEWRSLAYVALATAYANFVHLLDDSEQLSSVFDDAVPVLPNQRKQDLVRDMKKAWGEMQKSLHKKQKEWVKRGDTDTATADPNNYRKDVNYMYFRPTPKDCHTGPGY